MAALEEAYADSPLLEGQDIDQRIEGLMSGS
jgi:hypothetical protein